jgi:hypothetical protein
MRKSVGIFGLFLLLLFASGALADELTDRAAINRALSSLNASSGQPPAFTVQGNAATEIEQLRRAHPRGFRITGTAELPSVAISHEVWGEATLTIPVEFPMASRNIAFVTPDVATVEGSYRYEDETGAVRTMPLFFVVKRESGEWKVASVKGLAAKAN